MIFIQNLLILLLDTTSKMKKKPASDVDTGSKALALDETGTSDSFERVNKEEQGIGEENLDLSLLEENFSSAKESNGNVETDSTYETDLGNDSISIDELEDDDPPPFVK